MRVNCRKLVAFLLLGNSAVVKPQPRSPEKPRPIAPRKPLAAAPKPKPAAPVPKPLAAAPKPVSPVPGSSCPVIAPYTKPPIAQCATCYRDMSALTKYLNSNSKVVSATICGGTFALPSTAAVYNSNITSLTLSCCGNAKSCIIDGGAASSTPVVRTKRLFTFVKAIILDIQGITFQNFNCSSDDSEECYGGLLSTSSSALVTFKHNTVRKVNSYDYGALDLQAGTFFVFENCTFSDNSAAAQDSYSAVAYIDDSTVFMNGNLFARNLANVGAALYFSDSHVDTFCNKFEGNRVIGSADYDYYSNDYSFGGAIYLVSSSLDAKFNHFMNNTATLGYGGAIASYASQLHLSSNTFSLNTADYGGAVGDADFSPDGGAINLQDSSLDAKFNHFMNNTALGYGGAINSENSQLYFTSNTFSLNTAYYGGAVAGVGSGIVTNADSFTNNAATTGNNIGLYRTVMKTCPGTLPGVSVDSDSITVVQCV